MSKLILILAIFVFACAVDRGEGRCKKHDRGCCRQRIDRGRCDNRHHHNHHHGHHHDHHRRWAYNVTCGQCVQFDYSGCGGDENNFEKLEDCSSCCQGTSPCAKYTLARPPNGCEYKWDNGPDVCPRPRLECNKCGESHCRPDSCRHGERCVAEHHHSPCTKCPCQKYRCVTDPCFAVQQHLRPCEKCVAVEAPCQHHPCPLVAHRENHCPAPVVIAPPQYHQHCPHFVPCGPEGDGCSNRHCPAQPRARCVVDPCNCKRHNWQCDGKTYSDVDCFYGRH